MSYNPSLHTTSNKPYGVQGLPIDARSYYYDEVSFTYRPYNNNAEVLAYLNTSNKRIGNFSIFIKDGLGLVREWWFKDGTTNADLVEKISGSSTGSPVTFIQKTLGGFDSEVIVAWDTPLLQKHGSRPVYIDLYELTPFATVKCTSPVYSEDGGDTYRWFVGPGSSRTWEVRIMGYTEDNLPTLPTVPGGIAFTYTFSFPFIYDIL